MFPTGIITRNVKVGPAFDLLSGAAYSIRVMVEPSRILLWQGDPFMTKMKVYTFGAGIQGLIELPITNQHGYTDTRGQAIPATDHTHTHFYKISVFYLRNGAVVKTIPQIRGLIPEGEGDIDVDNMLPFHSDAAGGGLSIPDSWSDLLVSATAAAAAAQEAAAEAVASASNVDELVMGTVTTYFEANPLDQYVAAYLEEHPLEGVDQDQLDAALQNHIEAPAPHPAYDDLPSFTLLFENGLI